MAKKKTSSPTPKPASAPAPIRDKASIFSNPKPIPADLVDAIEALEKATGKDVWFILEGVYSIRPFLFEMFRGRKKELEGRDVVLIIDSFGGIAETAYRVADLFQRQCKSFTAIVPRFAKSAATLLALGADEIILGTDAHLGPLDVQFWDYDTEEGRVSALDTVQAIEQLEDSAIQVATRMLEYLKNRTKKSYNLLLEPSLKFAAEVTKPLFEKIDAVSYSRRSRMLSEAEDYGIRLLLRRKATKSHKPYQEQEAKALAHDLVTRYSTHEFVIDFEESKRLGLIRDDEGKEKDRVGLHTSTPPTSEVDEAIEKLYNSIEDNAAFGRLVN